MKDASKEYLHVADEWKDFCLLDCGDGEKLERWKDTVLIRPDPQVLWPKQHPSLWGEYDALYRREDSSKGKQWTCTKQLPEWWRVRYRSLSFKVKLTSFKHTGLFPEQSIQWDWLSKKIDGAIQGGMFREQSKPPRVLNLFGYTGAASLSCASAGAVVTHVDASKGTVRWCMENARLSELPDGCIRPIVDDVFQFVRREKRRGKTYDAILMDPPSFGRGTTGETWKLEKHLWKLLVATHSLLSSTPILFLVNVYKTGLSPTVLGNMLHSLMRLRSAQGKLTSGEVCLPIHNSSLVLPCGIFARWWS